jgi:hypothetical protein
MDFQIYGIFSSGKYEESRIFIHFRKLVARESFKHERKDAAANF